jgi:hypothetical protein
LAKTLWVLFVIIIPGLGVRVYLLASGHGMADRALEQQKELHAAQAENIRSVSGSQGGSASEQIQSAKSLLDSGAITQEEFDALKTKSLTS